MAVAIPHVPLADQISEDPNEALDMAASASLTSPSGKDDAALMPMPGDFDIVKHYGELLQRDEVRDDT